MLKQIRLLLVATQPRTRDGLRMRLEMEPDFIVAGEARDADQARSALLAAPADVVVIDVDDASSGDAVALTCGIRRVAPACAVIVLSMHDDATARAAARAAGATAFISKHRIDEALATEIRAAAQPHG